MFDDIYLQNGFIALPNAEDSLDDADFEVNIPIATVMSNLAKLGYTVDAATFKKMLNSSGELGPWWKTIEKTLNAITGVDKDMASAVVYKNFPREALALSQAKQVFHQLLIYFGVSYTALTETPIERPTLKNTQWEKLSDLTPLGDMARLKVLTFARSNTLEKIYTNLVSQPARWNENQADWAKRLFGIKARNSINFSAFGFKENAVTLAVQNIDTVEIQASSATDVLRIAAGLSGADISLREKVFFKKFSRDRRRRLVNCLNEQNLSNMCGDFVSRAGLWKLLLSRLHPGDFKDMKTVQAAYHVLYRKAQKPFSAAMNPTTLTIATLDLAVTRPGEFLRRFHRFYSDFPQPTVDRMVSILPKLTAKQLAGFRAYLRTANTRLYFIYPPKGNWSKAQVKPNDKMPIDHGHIKQLDQAIAGELGRRLNAKFPEGLAIDLDVDNHRLQTNDQKLASYGRGTEFNIPSSVKFLRSASYWKHDVSGTWYDNGWNFFDQDWQSVDVCSWDHQRVTSGRRSGSNGEESTLAIFSGDPLNSKQNKGRACQMIDIYLDELHRRNIRYAVWNILCYSKKTFADAEDVFATLQMGDDPEAGNLYEPSRAQFAFPLKGKQYTSYVAYVDVARRKLVYMDAPLRSCVGSASQNTEILSNNMPAYVEYLQSLPTVLDLIQDAKEGTIPVLWSDRHHNIQEGKALVLHPENETNKYERIALADVEVLGPSETPYIMGDTEDDEDKNQPDQKQAMGKPKPRRFSP